MTDTFALDLRACKTFEHLALALGVDERLLAHLCDARNDQLRYFEHRIPKRSARRKQSFRIVYEALGEASKLAHRAIARRLSLHASIVHDDFPLACTYGFIRKRSTKDNAARHLAARQLLRADIENFFGSITHLQVTDCFKALGIHASLANDLANLYCINGALAPGLSGSPLIANLVSIAVDRDLLELCRQLECVYTRYADDISISGSVLPSQHDLAGALARHGFRLSPSKFRITKPGQPQFVTGLSVTDASRPHVPKAMKRRLRQELYYAKRFGLLNHLEKTNQKPGHGLNRLDGLVKYVSFIERDSPYDMRTAWFSILSENDLSPTYTPRKLPSGKLELLIDETEFTVGETRYLAVGCAILYEPKATADAVDCCLDDYFAIPFHAGDRESILKNGLHFADCHPELRSRFIATLAQQPFRFYAMTYPLQSEEEYGDVHVALTLRLLLMLYPRCMGRSVEIRIENNPRVADATRSAKLHELYTVLEHADLPRPIPMPTAEVVGKLYRAMCVPDFMLGALRGYLRAGDDGRRLEQRHFEQLRDRFSYIFDLKTRTTFNRKNPLQPDSFHFAASD